MADTVQTLAQILADSRAANNPQVSNPQVGQLGFPQGRVSENGGALGAQLGAGAGDYIKETYVKAQKNKYLLENDPIEIEKRAEKFYSLYSNLSTQEQDQVDKWLNEDPQGLKWLDKLNKHAPYLMTKVPLSKDFVLANGQAADDVTWYRPLRTIQDPDKQKGAALARMSPTERNNTLFASENKDRVVAENVPQQIRNDTTTANASAMNARANAAMVPSQIDVNRSIAGRNDRYAPSTNAVGMKLRLQEHMDQQAQVKYINDQYKSEVAAETKRQDIGPVAKDFAINGKAIATATQLQDVDPLNPMSNGMFRSAAARLKQHAKSKNESTREQAFIQAKALLESWGANIRTRQGYRDYFLAVKELKWAYKDYFYPGAKMEDYNPLLTKELLRLKDPEVLNTIAAEEAALLSQRKALYDMQLQINE